MMQNEGAVAKGIKRLANALTALTDKVEKINSKAPEHIAVALYVIMHMLMSLVHEPWFDEALSWLIARDSSLYEIFFVTPHYEGHPALWHLILVPFAKLGAPYELSLSIVSLVFSGLAMALFIYKAPFKRIIRLIVPFSYYLFYQYGVISRPYCMMMLAFVLMAMAFKNRNEKPGRYVLSLWFLCISSAYGIVIAGGVCIVWGAETISTFVREHIIAKGKIFWLLGLLFYVIFILWRIIPAENTYASIISGSSTDENGLLIRILYSLFASTSDLFITNIFYTSGTLRNASFFYTEFISGVVVGLGILAAFILYAKNHLSKMKASCLLLLYFIIPYLFYTIFGAIVYLYYHHIGISLLLIGFWLWTVTDFGRLDSVRGNITDISDVSEKASKVSDDNKQRLYALGKFTVVLMVIIPIYWTISSCIVDVCNPYGSGREQYEFLNENGLDEGYTILTDWYKVFDTENVPENYTEYDLIFSQQGVNLAPYLKKSIIINTPDIIGKSYSYLHEIPDKAGMIEIYNKVVENGNPDIIVGRPDFVETEKTLEIHNPTHVECNDYVQVYKGDFGNIKKGFRMDTSTCIYVKKDLAEKLGIKEIDQ